MKKVLINGLGQSKNSKIDYNTTKNDVSFIYDSIFGKTSKKALREEKKIYKINALRSKTSKIVYKEWRKNQLSLMNIEVGARNQINHSLISKNLLQVVSNGDVPELKYEELNSTSTFKYIEDLTNTFKRHEVIIKKHSDNIVELLKNRPRKPSDAEKEQLKSNIERNRESIKAELTKFEDFIKSHVLTVKSLVTSAGLGSTLGEKPKTQSLSEFKNKSKIEAKEKNKKNSELVKTLPFYDRLFFMTNRNEYKLALSTNAIETLSSASSTSWENEFRRRNAQMEIDTLPSSIKIKNDEAKKYITSLNEYKDYIEKNGKKISPDIKIKIDEIKLEFKKQKADANKTAKIAGSSKRAKQVVFKKLRNDKKTNIHVAKLQHEGFKLKTHYRFVRAQAIKTVRLNNKLLSSNYLEIKKETPIEISKVQYWCSVVFGAIIPGVNSLINKQWVKGVMQVAATALFAILLAWSFGAFPSHNGNGIAGLSTLGAAGVNDLSNGFGMGITNGKVNDSRFFMVMGAMGILFLTLAIIYWIISFLNNLNQNNLAKLGVRYSSWKEQKSLLKTGGLPYLLSAPALIFIIFIVVLPIIATLMISFTNYGQQVWNGTQMEVLDGVQTPFEWVGVDQYKFIFTIIGPEFGSVFLWTMIWTFGATLLTMFLGTFFAILVNQNRIKGKTFFRIIYILPWAVPAFITIMFFSIFFQHNGIFNDVIGEKIFGRNVDWLDDGWYTKALVIFLQGWLGQSYMFLLITGMLQSIPKSLYEAARVDGATGTKQFSTITLPIIVAQIAPLLIGQFVFNFNNFGMIYLFNGGGVPGVGDTAGEFDIFISWIYRMVNSGSSSMPGAGAAMSLVISVFMVTPSAFMFFRSKSFRMGGM